MGFETVLQQAIYTELSSYGPLTASVYDDAPQDGSFPYVVIGDDENNTAMAKTVGLPIGIAAKQILQGNIKAKGVCLPMEANIYEPILKELEDYGIHFVEKEM